MTVSDIRHNDIPGAYGRLKGDVTVAPLVDNIYNQGMTEQATVTRPTWCEELQTLIEAFSRDSQLSLSYSAYILTNANNNYNVLEAGGMVGKRIALAAGARAKLYWSVSCHSEKPPDLGIIRDSLDPQPLSEPVPWERIRSR